LVVDSFDVSTLMQNGGSFSVANLPGGTTDSPLAGAYYAMTVLGWGNGKFGWGVQRYIDLTTGSATAAITVR
jgi:hypothetical protein